MRPLAPLPIYLLNVRRLWERVYYVPPRQKSQTILVSSEPAQKKCSRQVPAGSILECPFLLVLEFGVDENPFLTELITEPYEVKDGYVEISKKPGLGIEIDEDVLRKYLVK